MPGVLPDSFDRFDIDIGTALNTVACDSTFYIRFTLSTPTDRLLFEACELY